jgi:hypothetical protein
LRKMERVQNGFRQIAFSCSTFLTALSWPTCFFAN